MPQQQFHDNRRLLGALAHSYLRANDAASYYIAPSKTEAEQTQQAIDDTRRSRRTNKRTIGMNVGYLLVSGAMTLATAASVLTTAGSSIPFLSEELKPVLEMFSSPASLVPFVPVSVISSLLVVQNFRELSRLRDREQELVWQQQRETLQLDNERSPEPTDALVIAHTRSRCLHERV
jgi:hypothetical protein